MNSPERYGSLLARGAIAAIFIIWGVRKLTGLAATSGYIASKGLPSPMILGVVAGVLELVAGLALLVGFRARHVALALTAFLVPVTITFHNPIGLAGEELERSRSMGRDPW